MRTARTNTAAIVATRLSERELLGAKVFMVGSLRIRWTTDVTYTNARPLRPRVVFETDSFAALPFERSVLSEIGVAAFRSIASNL
jgi:hypothetical protein